MTNSVCVDASVALAWLLPGEQSETIDSLFYRWEETGASLITAPLFHAEVTSVIRQKVYFKKLSPAHGERAFGLYKLMDIHSIGRDDVYRRAWELAIEYNLPGTYDTQYLAVAELEDCELWTIDKRFFNSLQGKEPRLRLVGEGR